MDVSLELREIVQRAAAGAVPLDALYEWLAARVQVLADSRYAEASQMADQAWIALGEWQSCVRTEDEARAALLQLVDRAHTAAVKP